MRKLALVFCLLSSLSFAANSFPPCKGAFINQVWKAQDGTYWYCDGANWSSVAAGIAIAGGDAGFNNVSVMNLVVVDGGTIGPFILQGATANSGKITLNTSSNPELDLNDTVGSKLIYSTDYIQLFGDRLFRVGADAGVLASRYIVVDQYVPTQHGTTQLAFEIGADAGTAGVLTVTFATAFSAAPICMCSHVDVTNTNTCTIDHTTVPTTALAKFNVASGGTDKIYWMCVGTK